MKDKNKTIDKNQEEIVNPLGIDTTSLGSLKVKDLTNNLPLANTILTYLRNCERDKAELQTQNETLKTYATAYDKRKLQGKIAAGLGIISTILIGFGINFLSATPVNNISGAIFLSVGILIALGGLILSFADL